ncbi:hypothetical protein [Kitasatospora phosalacinea]|uniref:Enolase n=1 Tax=Kitasatospora phosalacinea TaxID=2065 RepID=A0A0M3WPF1_9ACTN|nr:hypothetical protein [Kitasatospora phosalacinea]AKO69610.1 PhpH [Kitasatospora phosalacinea]
MRVTALLLRGILDSRGEPTVEAELELSSGHRGRGSAPRAIAPGRLERSLGDPDRIGRFPSPALAARLTAARDLDQPGLDALLTAAHDEGAAGAATTLAVSLAFARAAADARGEPLHRALAAQAGSRPALPRLMVNVFSGGIHRREAADGFQQVMLLPAGDCLTDDVRVAALVHRRAEELAVERFGTVALSASSGLLAPVGTVGQLELLEKAVADTPGGDRCTVGVDVAAEHLLADDGRYRFDGGRYEPGAFAELLAELVERHRITFLEDPFDPAHQPWWRRLRGRLPASAAVVGDDLFATDAARIDRSLADGVLLKPSQVGTVSGTLAAAAAARDAGMLLAVSHRSGETEDTAMCDLAVAVGAELIKIGGPRRGDRLVKYNQLLRLAEELPSGASPSGIRAD